MLEDGGLAGSAGSIDAQVWGLEDFVLSIQKMGDQLVWQVVAMKSVAEKGGSTNRCNGCHLLDNCLPGG